MTQHAVPGCECEYAKEVVEIIQAGGIQVVSWRKDVVEGSRFLVEDARAFVEMKLGGNGVLFPPLTHATTVHDFMKFR